MHLTKNTTIFIMFEYIIKYFYFIRLFLEIPIKKRNYSSLKKVRKSYDIRTSFNFKALMQTTIYLLKVRLLSIIQKSVEK